MGSHLRKQFGELTKNTFEFVPLWWIKGPGVLAGDLDERRCEPEFREWLSDPSSTTAVYFVPNYFRLYSVKVISTDNTVQSSKTKS